MTTTPTRPAPRPAPRLSPSLAEQVRAWADGMAQATIPSARTADPRERTALAGHLYGIADGGPDFAQAERILAAAVELIRKLDEHERRGWQHIRVGALHELRDALSGAGSAAGEAVWCDTHNPAGTPVTARTAHAQDRECRNPHGAGVPAGGAR